MKRGEGKEGLAMERDTGIHCFLWTFPFNAHMFDGPGRSGCIGMKDRRINQVWFLRFSSLSKAKPSFES